MFSKIATAGLLAITMTLPMQPAKAQDQTLGGAVIGGVIGAGVGGAVSGRTSGAIVGGVIGATLGATIGNQMEPRGGYYRYQGECWRRRGDGSYVRIYRRYCD